MRGRRSRLKACRPINQFRESLVVENFDERNSFRYRFRVGGSSISLEVDQVDSPESLDLASDLLHLFFATMERDLVEIDRALVRGDVLRLASMAHRIKTTAAKVGATETSRAAAKIEFCCRSGRTESLAIEVEGFRQVQEKISERWKQQLAESELTSGSN